MNIFLKTFNSSFFDSETENEIPAIKIILLIIPINRNIKKGFF